MERKPGQSERAPGSGIRFFPTLAELVFELLEGIDFEMTGSAFELRLGTKGCP